MNVIGLIGDALSGFFLGLLLAIVAIVAVAYLIKLLFSPHSHSVLSIITIVVLSFFIITHAIGFSVVLSLKSYVNDVLEMGASALADGTVAESFSSIVNSISPDAAEQLESASSGGVISEDNFQIVGRIIKRAFNSMVIWEFIKFLFYTILAVILGGLLGDKRSASRRSSSRPSSRTGVRPRGGRSRR